jgi:ABC-type polysaccharide/polyol phosphate transport system ATPase subunit
MAMLELDNVSLSFRVRKGARVGFKDLVLHPRRTLRDATVTVHALQGVSLRVREGERVGVLGGNGAGKSTLLRVMAGVYPPTGGRLRAEGRVNSLFDITLGMEPTATGWENIRYRGYLQGETPASLRAKMAAIADFSELGSFLDLPIHGYSLGMRLRLAFSIAVAIEPEILLVDEVLSVGDLAFQDKARRRLREMMDRALLIVMVSHDLASLAAACERGVWLDQGRVRADGPIAEVIAAYVARCTSDGRRGGGWAA